MTWTSMKKYLYIAYLIVLLVGIPLFLFQGCAIGSLELGVHRTIAIEKPPYRVTLSGDIQDRDYQHAQEILLFLEKQKYRDHNFSNFKVEVYGSQNTQHTNYTTNNTNNNTNSDSSENSDSE